jgi:hypothetical protein
VVDTRDPVLRDAVLVTLPLVAPPPCDLCEDALENAVLEQDDDGSLAALTLETRVVLAWYQAR